MERKRYEPGSMFDDGDGPPGCYSATPREEDIKYPTRKPGNVINFLEGRCLVSVRRMAGAYIATTSNPEPDPAA